MTKKFKVTQDRIQCIGCGSCAAMCPDIWVMRADGKAGLVGAKEDPELEEIVIDETKIEKAREVEKACPVDAAKIEEVVE
jgi:ferredoxin